MLRRRTLVAGVITLLFLLFSNSLWLVKKPVDLEFNLEGVDSVKISYKLSDGIFNSKIVSKNFDLINSSKIKISTDKLFFNKVKVIVNTESREGGNLLKASIPTLRKGKYKLEDTKKYKVSDATISKEGEFFYISPRSSSFKMIYDVSGHAQTKFEFEIFVIILVLSYLLSYKLVDYLADFKTIKNQSRIDIIFLTIFFVILFFPMSHINRDTVSKAENRTLAKWKPLLSQDGKINYNFGKDYDNWYNDRFFLRSPIVKVYDIIRYYIALNYYENAKGFVNKRNNWISGKVDIVDYVATEENKILVEKNIKLLESFCKRNNIKFYIIVAPRKPEICNKEIYPIIGKTDSYNKTTNIIKYIKEKTGYSIIFPFKDLKKLQADGFADFKTDHHWTDEGAYIAYEQVIAQINKDFPIVNIIPKDDFEIIYSNKVRVSPNVGFFNGRTYEVMNLKNKNILDTTYKYLKHKTSYDIEYNHQIFKKDYYHIHTYRNKKNAPDVVLFGDSFSLNLLPSITPTFKTTTNIYTYVSIPEKIKEAFKIERFEDIILKNNPDIIIICVSDIERLQYLFEEDE